MRATPIQDCRDSVGKPDLMQWVQDRCVPSVDAGAVVCAARASTYGGSLEERARDHLSGALLAKLRETTGPAREPLLESLVRLWSGHVLRWCRMLSSAAVTPDDASQDVLVALTENPPQLKRADGLRQWLWGVTWRTVRGHRRKAWVRKWLPGSTDNRDWMARLPGRSEWTEEQVAIKQLLERLPAADRELLWLAYAEGASRQELCAHFGCAEGTLARKLTAARAQITQLAKIDGWPQGRQA